MSATTRCAWVVYTKHPVAVDSPDHLHPYGTLNDNSGKEEFVGRLRALSVSSVLDLGCAGGLFVRQCVEAGMDALGLEGSDINKRTGRAEWPIIPDNLFTCDVAKSFEILKDDRPFLFDCITAWEFLEHIAKDDLHTLFANIDKHTHSGSLFCCSITSTDSPFEGVDLHQTQESDQWWDYKFENNDWIRSEGFERHFAGAWVRTGTFERVYVKK